MEVIPKRMQLDSGNVLVEADHIKYGTANGEPLVVVKTLDVILWCG